MMGKEGRLRIQPLYIVIVAALLIASASIVPRVIQSPDDTPPQVDVWYGSRQVFGHSGLPQRWIDVLGNAADPESGISSLRYQINDGKRTIARLGPDPRRLAKPGDFNLEIDPAQLDAGENRLQIEAVNGAGKTTRVQITLVYERNPISPPFSIDWAKVKNAQDVLQVVDGKWKWDANGIRPVELGYDRMLNVGDSSWTDYEVSVPVTVYGYDPAAFDQKTGGRHAGISIDLRWLGHSDVPEVCPPPHCGWDPVGNFNKYWFMPDGADFLGMKTQEKQDEFPSLPYHVQIGHTYWFKASVETVDGENIYRMKVWEAGVETEPEDWLFESRVPAGDGATDNPRHGAFALVAHHSDVSFGNVSVTPLP